MSRSNSNSNSNSNSHSYEKRDYKFSDNKTKPFPFKAKIFSWPINGEMKEYTPCVWDTLTYCLPRVHISVSKDFLARKMEEFFWKTFNFRAPDVNRIDLVPINGSEHFVKAFVTHYEYDSYNPRQPMSIISHITEKIFSSEFYKKPMRVEFTHNYRNNYWIILPNLNPLTNYQHELIEQIQTLSSELITNLEILATSGIPIPKWFNISVLDENRISTAWTPLREQNLLFNDKLDRLHEQNNRIKEYITKHGCMNTDDIEEMEKLKIELNEEELDAAHAFKEAAGDFNQSNNDCDPYCM